MWRKNAWMGIHLESAGIVEREKYSLRILTSVISRKALQRLMRYGIWSDNQDQIHQNQIVAHVLTVKMAGATNPQFDAKLENTDLYTVKEMIDYHGSRIDQASYIGDNR